MTPPDRAEQERADVIGQLIGLCGEAPVFKLIEAAGGTRLYVPRNPVAGNRISCIVGLGAAKAIGARFGGLNMKLPLARAWRVRVYRGQGMSYAQIASAIGISESAVFGHLKDMGLTRQTRGANGRPSQESRAMEAAS
jgi:hypothetical protein